MNNYEAEEKGMTPGNAVRKQVHGITAYITENTLSRTRVRRFPVKLRILPSSAIEFEAHNWTLIKVVE